MKRNDATVDYENTTAMPKHRQLRKRIWGVALAGALLLGVFPAVFLAASGANSFAYAQSASSEQTEENLALGSEPAASGETDTQSFDCTESYSRATASDDESVSSEDETAVGSDFETTEANGVSEASGDRAAFDEQQGAQTSLTLDDGGAAAVSAGLSTDDGAHASTIAPRRSSSEVSQRGFAASAIEALAAVLGS